MPALTNGTLREIISNRSIDQPRALKVIVVGAGISGILAAIKLQERVGNLTLKIYDKNEDLGGTWFKNRYPDCACGKLRRPRQGLAAQALVVADICLDIPAHCYQLSFESNPCWSHFYASAPEILEYWRKVATKYDVHKYMVYRSRVTKAQWNEETAKWTVTIQSLSGDFDITDEADVLISGTGLLNEWRWPDIAGLHSFKGDLVHSANWLADFRSEVRQSDSQWLCFFADQPAGKTCCHHRSWLQWHTDSAVHSAHGEKTGPLRSGKDVDCNPNGVPSSRKAHCWHRQQLQVLRRRDPSLESRSSPLSAIPENARDRTSVWPCHHHA